MTSGAHGDRAQGGFFERHPAVARLFRARPRRVPYVAQMSDTDCAAACLTMVLGFHGKDVSLTDVREVAQSDRGGLDALSLINAGRWYGLRGRGVAVDIEDLDLLPRGSVLHWDMCHFVVLERPGKKAVEIVDPRAGPRRVPMGEFRKSFTGVAVLFEPADDFVAGRVGERPARALVRTILTSYPGLWTRVLVTSLLLQIFALALPILTAAVVDHVVPKRDHHLLWVILGALAMMVAFAFASSLIRAHLLLRMRTYFDARMTLAFVEHVVALPYRFFESRSTGDILDRIFSNKEIRELVTTGALSAILDGALMGLYLVLILALSPILGLVIAALGAAHALVFWATRTRQREYVAEGLFHNARSYAYTIQMLAGVETVKLAGAESIVLEYWSNLFVKTLNNALGKGALDAVVDAALATLRMASPLVVLGVGASLVLGGDLALGAMLGLSALAAGFLIPLSQFIDTAIRFQALPGYLDRYDDVLRTEPEIQPGEVKPAARLRGGVALEAVTLRYGPLTAPAVEDVSLRVEPGSFVAIVGRSGAGKTTLAGLLTGLHVATEGRVLFDGVDLRALDITSVRRQIGVVPQNPFVFSKSIRHNIALGDLRLDDAAVERAARLACAHDFIAALPMGYHTPLSEGGKMLSGGERQRIVLARALARQPRILLLDEATSALDAATEAEVQAAIAALDCTRVVIAHRLSTVQTADVIVVMDGGRVAETGTHAELLARRGVYYDLVHSQLQGAP